MKTLGLIFILGVMAWSWTMFYSPKSGVSEQTMVQIQDGLQDQILKVMEAQNENLNNIVFKKFSTKELNEKKVQANFLIAFDEDVEGSINKIERKGHVILVKLDESNDEQVWAVDSIKIEGETIEFEEGLRFKASDPAADDQDEVEPNAEASTEVETVKPQAETPKTEE